MRVMNVFLAVTIAAAMLPGAASAQMNQVYSYGFGKTGTPARTTATPGGLKATGSANKAPRVATFAPLSKEECVGLGGKVHIHLCKGRMGLACTTVDQHGVVRTECVNK